MKFESNEMELYNIDQSNNKIKNMLNSKYKPKGLKIPSKPIQSLDMYVINPSKKDNKYMLDIAIVDILNNCNTSGEEKEKVLDEKIKLLNTLI